MNNSELKKIICKILSCKDKIELVSLSNRITAENWNYIYDFLLSYNLCPLFYSLVKQNDLNVPIEIIKKLHKSYLISSALHLKKTHELKNVLLEFNKENIDVMPLKGIYLAEKYYENSALRPMVDIDILVKPDDVKKALYILEKLGFRCSKDYDHDFQINNHKHLPAFYSKSNVAIELHFTLFTHAGYYLKSVKIDLDNIWSTSSKTILYGQKTTQMSVENLILHLCVHIAEDKFKQKILHLFDVFQVIKNENINWQLLISKSKEWKAEKILYCVLLSLNNLFNLKINDIVQQNLVFKGNMSEIECSLEKKLLCDLSSQSFEMVSNFKHRNFIDKLKYIKYTLFSDYSVCMFYGISDKSFKKYFYYIPRFFYLFKKYSKHFIDLYILRKGRHLQDTSISFNLFDEWIQNNEQNFKNNK